jgi:hypothetical protein
MNTHTHKLIGSHYILSVLPIWVTALILFTVTQLAMLVGRDVLEGLPYQVSCSAMIGDAGFVVIVLIAAEIFHYRGLRLLIWPSPSTLRGHVTIIIISVMLGITVSVFTLESRSGQAMDVYHDVVIAPMFVYLACTLLPIIWHNGTKLEKRVTVLLILLWVGLVGFDVKYQRMNQRQWLQNHGVTLQQVKS